MGNRGPQPGGVAFEQLVGQVDIAEAIAVEEQISEAADFINDALAEFPKDKYAAVLQAAIARRD
jgi:hypothetical protein